MNSLTSLQTEEHNNRELTNRLAAVEEQLKSTSDELQRNKK